MQRTNESILTIIRFQEVIPYKGPLNLFRRYNPYVFGLYRQAGDVNVTTAFDYVMLLRRTDDHVEINRIMNAFNLTGKFTWCQCQ